MKAIICLLVTIGTANAGFLFGGLGLGLGGGAVNSGWSGGSSGAVNSGWAGGAVNSGWAGGYGGGWSIGKSIDVPAPKIIKVIEAPAPIAQPAPIQIVKVIREAQPIVAPAWKIVKIIEQPSYSSQGWA